MHETLKDAKEGCIRNVSDYYQMDSDEVKSFMEFQKKGESFRYDYVNHTSFFVNEIFEMDRKDIDDQYICIQYHAYNGVDFSILKVGNYEECILFMHEDYKNILGEIDFISETEICIDIECEWMIWNVLKIRDYFNENYKKGEER